MSTFDYAVTALAILLFVALCVGVDMAWNQWLHGDWRCAFAQCRIETL